MKPLFIAGIGTNVGKTIVSAIFTEAMQADYWKPVQSGNTEDTDSLTVKNLITNKRSVIHPERYNLKAPVSPHYAAKLEGIEIDIQEIILPETMNKLIVEGAGGLMTPLNTNTLIIDLIKKFDAEVVLVIRHYLGSINHSLLSIDALNARGIMVKGLVFNGKQDYESEIYIESYSKMPVLLRVDEEEDISKRIILKYALQLTTDN